MPVSLQLLQPAFYKALIICIILLFLCNPFCMAQTDTVAVAMVDTPAVAKDSVVAKPVVKDRIYLVNGSFVEGKLLKMENARFNFRADNLTTVNIDKRNVATIYTPTNKMRVELIDGRLLYGHFDPLPTASRAYLRYGPKDSMGQEDGLVINLLELNSIFVDNNSFFKNIRGNVTAGFSYTRSSNIARLNFANSLLYTRHQFNFEQRTSAINTLSDTVPSFERVTASLVGYYKMQSKWRAAALFEYQRLAELGIKARLIATTGVGYPIINTRRMYFVTLAGISVNRELTFGQKLSPFQFEFPLLLRLSLYKLKSGDFTLTTTTYFYQGITNASRRRLDQSTTLAFSVFKDIDLSIEIFVNFDSQPKTAGVNKADYGTVFGLSYNF
jgi:hypothetical protein